MMLALLVTGCMSRPHRGVHTLDGEVYVSGPYRGDGLYIVGPFAATSTAKATHESSEIHDIVDGTVILTNVKDEVCCNFNIANAYNADVFLLAANNPNAPNDMIDTSQMSLYDASGALLESSGFAQTPFLPGHGPTAYEQLTGNPSQSTNGLSYSCCGCKPIRYCHELDISAYQLKRVAQEDLFLSRVSRVEILLSFRFWYHVVGENAYRAKNVKISMVCLLDEAHWERKAIEEKQRLIEMATPRSILFE